MSSATLPSARSLQGEQGLFNRGSAMDIVSLLVLLLVAALAGALGQARWRSDRAPDVVAGRLADIRSRGLRSLGRGGRAGS